ncbi:unnamed protein product [Closterium sp. Yama58-4]|nr:unnamed protein product [Closterium sp. Yama58-4]
MRASLADPSISGPPISTSSTDEKPPLLTPEQGRIVRETFAEFIQPNADQHAIILFLIVFDISPDGRNLFSYVRNSTEPAPLNKRLQEHATHAFGLMCEAIMQMDDADVNSIFENIGEGDGGQVAGGGGGCMESRVRPFGIHRV